MCKKVICFDLDDTLYKEIDFVESAYREIAESEKRPDLLPKMMGWQKNGDNVFFHFNKAIGKETIIPHYLTLYRSHYPTISLSACVEETLNELEHRGITLGLITDGRSISQRNKIKALGLDRWFDNENIIISEETNFEKTEEPNFRYFVKKYQGAELTYIGDNPKKDFIVPNRLGWKTVMLKDDGRNIHKQEAVPVGNLSQITITSIDELLDFIK
jgi:putative hydrolase of the HAD superfamily